MLYPVCGDLPLSPTNGMVSGSGHLQGQVVINREYLQGDVVTYSCNDGYVLEGETTSTCQADRSWDNVNSTTCRAGLFIFYTHSHFYKLNSSICDTDQR